ncbi:MAG: hypothetical protein M3044_07110 [Thermoproteota archaeon]|nr:hypothetical protein [Thermoproteota archaeon]
MVAFFAPEGLTGTRLRIMFLRAIVATKELALVRDATNHELEDEFQRLKIILLNTNTERRDCVLLKVY